MRKLVFLSLFLLGLFNAGAQTKQLAFTGWNEYQIDFGSNTGSIKVEKINNYRNGGKSGSLYIQVWLLPAPYRGQAMEGYKLADIHIGQLNGGYMMTGMNYPISWDMNVPAGSYYVSFFLVEYNPRPGGNFWVEDYLNFDQKATKSEVRPETKAEAMNKLTTILKRAEQLNYNGNYFQMTLLRQTLNNNSLTIQRQDNDAGRVTQDYKNIPWGSLYSIDAYADKTGSGDILWLSLNFDDPMNYTYAVEGRPSATSVRKDMSQVNLYIRRSDHAETVRLLNLLADGE
jgi:hypothetical protein